VDKILSGAIGTSAPQTKSLNDTVRDYIQANPSASKWIGGYWSDQEYNTQREQAMNSAQETKTERAKRSILDPGNLLQQHKADTDGQGLLSTNNPVARQQELTTFQDSDQTMREIVPFCNKLHARLRACDEVHSDIKRILERPTLLPPLVWNATHEKGTIIGYYNLPHDILAYTNKLIKLAGFQYWKADCVFRIHLVSQTFQAGRVWVCFDPYRSQRGGNIASNLTQFLCLSGVSLDPSQPLPVDFRVPFSSILAMWNTNKQSTAGQLIFVVQNKLSSASTSESTTIQVSAWFDEVELSMPSANAVYVAQGNFEREQDQAAKGSISTGFAKVSEIAGEIMHIPLIQHIATPVYWATKAASKLAKAFGFAKPNNDVAPIRTISQPGATITNFDNISNALSLTHSAKYCIDQTSNFTAEVDEMDISYIVSNMTIVSTLNWAKSSIATTNLGTIPVFPGLSPVVIAASGDQFYESYDVGPMAYVASMFGQWGGTLKFKFELVGTALHSGRLAIVYYPFYDSLTLPAFNALGDNYNIMWDVASNPQISFEIPHTAQTPYLLNYIDTIDLATLITASSSTAEAAMALRTHTNGLIGIYVVNPLVAPDTVASTVQINIWAGGGRDLTFAEPRLGVYAPVVLSQLADRIDNSGKDYNGVAVTAASNHAYTAQGLAPAELNTPSQPQIIILPDGTPTEVQSVSVVQHVLTSLPLLAGLNITKAEDVDLTQQGQFKAQSNPGFGSSDLMNPTTTSSQRNPFPNFIPTCYLEPRERAKLVHGELITNLRQLTRQLSDAYILRYPDVVQDGQLDTQIPVSTDVLVLDPTYFGLNGAPSASFLTSRCYGTIRGGSKYFIVEVPSWLNIIAQMYVYARGTRRYAMRVQGSKCLNGARFNYLHSPDGDGGIFEITRSLAVGVNLPSIQPYFYSDVGCIDTTYDSQSTATLPYNAKGLNRSLVQDPKIIKSSKDGSFVEFSVPMGNITPNVPLLTPFSSDFTSRGQHLPTTSRKIEIRYNPLASARSGVTTNYSPDYWPLPTRIMEAGGDDFSFSGLVNPPRILRINRSCVIRRSQTDNAFV